MEHKDLSLFDALFGTVVVLVDATAGFDVSSEQRGLFL
jgi:hypothetical protein